MNTDLNYRSLCRGCMCPLDNKIVSMKHESVKNLFRLCTSLRVETTDELPKYLCRKCFTSCHKWKMFQEKCAESQEKFNEIISARKEQIAINEDIREEAEKESSFDKTLPIEMVEVKTEIPEISSDSADESDDEKFDAALDSYPTEVKVVKEVEEEEEKIPRPLLLVVKQLPTPTGSKKVINEQPKYIFKCKECKQIFSNLLAYENHYKIAHIVSYPCQICLESFRTEEKLLNHQIATHTVNVRRELYICNACDRGFDQKYLYSQHMRNHEHESLTCLKCKKDFKSYTSLQNHKKTYHGNIHFECDQCDKTFRTSNKLSYHLKLHTELRTFICHHCGKGFMDNNGLKRHVLFVHELEAKFACHICPHKSKTEKKLAKHIQLHTAEKNIACDLCPMKFKTFPTFKNHRLIHTGEKRFFCDICDEGFLRDCSLKKHMVKHIVAN